MNWRMLLYFLTNKVVPSGHKETEELLKLVEQINQILETQKVA
jgi:TATA-box binding protein (TBP) (component of TFIID and TFIIIB)